MKTKTTIKTEKRQTRRNRIRSKISGTAKIPRLSVFKSNKFIYAQLINDDKGNTISASFSKDAEKVGTEIAKKGLGKKIKKVVFDRGGYVYTGSIKKLAETARKGGLKF